MAFPLPPGSPGSLQLDYYWSATASSATSATSIAGARSCCGAAVPRSQPPVSSAMMMSVLTIYRRARGTSLSSYRMPTHLQSPMSPLCRGDVRCAGCGDAVRPCYGIDSLVQACVSGELCFMKDHQRSRIRAAPSATWLIWQSSRVFW